MIECGYMVLLKHAFIARNGFFIIKSRKKIHWYW